MAAKITKENVKQASGEQLRARLAELKGSARVMRKRDANAVDAERFAAMALKLGDYDIDKSLDLQSKAQQSRARAEDNKLRKVEQVRATAAFDDAVKAWQGNKEGPAEQAGVLSAIANAKIVGLNLPNPISNWVQEKQFGANMEIKKQEILSKEKQQEIDNKYKERELAQKDRLADIAAQRARKLKDDGVTSLNAETIGKVSNLQTVLVSIDEIRDALSDLREADGPLSSYKAYRSLQSSVRLAVENLGRVQSGGAITTDEQALFKDLLAPGLLDFVDGGESFNSSLGKIASAIQNKLNNYTQGGISKNAGEGDTPPPAATPVVNPNKVTPTKKDF